MDYASSYKQRIAAENSGRHGAKFGVLAWALSTSLRTATYNCLLLGIEPPDV